MTWIAAFFLFFVVFAALISSLGLLFATDEFDRLHYLGPVTLLGSLAILIAVIVYEGFTVLSGKAAITVLIMLVTGPVITHALARAGIARGDALRIRNKNLEDSI